MSRTRYTRLQSDESDSFTQRANDYYSDPDQQDLLPEPPSDSGNSTSKNNIMIIKFLLVNYVIKKFGWWLLVIMFPYVFAPIFFIRKLYARSKRVSLFCHSVDYLHGF